jgi:hypothetical protein
VDLILYLQVLYPWLYSIEEIPFTIDYDLNPEMFDTLFNGFSLAYYFSLGWYAMVYWTLPWTNDLLYVLQRYRGRDSFIWKDEATFQTFVSNNVKSSSAGATSSVVSSAPMESTKSSHVPSTASTGASGSMYKSSSGSGSV